MASDPRKGRSPDKEENLEPLWGKIPVDVWADEHLETFGPPAPARFGKYLLIDKLAQGGMAEVYRAIMTGPAAFEKTVAVKRILSGYGELPDFRERFIEEARIAADLTHSNIVHVIEFGEIDRRYYLAMEYVDGMDGEKLLRLAKEKGESLALAGCYIIAQVARGLAYAHAAEQNGQKLGLVHRDVSPQNIMMSYSGEVKIADFGIAKVETAYHTKTASGAVMGKLRYMSPEQVSGTSLDGRSDIFALGLVLYEFLVGEKLLDAESPAGVVDQIKTARFPRPSQRGVGVPPDVDRIVAQALAGDREVRYQTADDMARELERLLRVHEHGFGREDMGRLLTRLQPVRPAAAASRRTMMTVPPVEATPTPAQAVARGMELAETLTPDQGMKVGRAVAAEAMQEPPTPTPTRTPTVVTERVERVGWWRWWMGLGVFVVAVAGGAIWLFVREDRMKPTTTTTTPTTTTERAAEPVAAVVPAPAPAPAVVPEKAPVVVEKVSPPVARVEPVVKARKKVDGVFLVTETDLAESPEVARARANCRKGDGLLAAGNPAGAEKAYLDSLAIYPGYIASYRGLGRAYAKQGNAELAVSSFRMYLKHLPGAADSGVVRRWLRQLEADPATQDLR